MLYALRACTVYACGTKHGTYEARPGAGPGAHLPICRPLGSSKTDALHLPDFLAYIEKIESSFSRSDVPILASSKTQRPRIQFDVQRMALGHLI